MSGECKSYRLNSPMSWDEFKAMPDDIKATYINLLRNKFGVPDSIVAEMMGVHKVTMPNVIKRIGLGHGVKHGGRKTWNKEGFYAWLNGVEKVPAPVIEEPTQEEAVDPIPAQDAEPEAYMEEDVPFIQPEPSHPIRAELELMKAKEENAWLRNECNRNDMKIRILEAQMEVVRMIFGGSNHG